MIRLGSRLLILLLVVGCTAAGPSGPGTSAPSDAGPSLLPSAAGASASAPLGPPPALAAACQSSDARAITNPNAFWLIAEDGVRLYAVEAGSGPVGIVLANQARASLCGWVTYMRTLVDAGLRVLAFDFRASGKSTTPADSAVRMALDQDLAAASARLRDDGAERVVLIGASLGGAAAVQYGATLDVDAIVSLSGTHIWPGFGENHPENLPKLSVPFLMIVSQHDPAAPVAEATQVVDDIGSADKQIIVLDGSAHGWSLVQVGLETQAVQERILAWIHAHEQ